MSGFGRDRVLGVRFSPPPGLPLTRRDATEETSIQGALMSQQAKIVDLEDRSRRSNLVVFGIPEEPNESEAVLRNKVITEVFERKLEVKCVSIGRIHRLGKPSEMRPIILYFQDFTEKEAVLSNAKKLKGTSISVQNDYCAETLRKRKLLWDSAKQDKDTGKKVWLVHDKISIDKQLYYWDNTSNSRKAMLRSNNLTSTS